MCILKYILIILAFILIISVNVNSAIDSDEIEMIDVLSIYRNQITSFESTYKIRSEHIQGSIIEEVHDFKMANGVGRYLKRKKSKEDIDNSPFEAFSEVNGEIRTLVSSSDSNSEKISNNGQIDYPRWPVARGAFVTPLELIGDPEYTLSLDDFIEKSNIILEHLENGNLYFTATEKDTNSRVRIQLDSEFRIVTIEKGSVFSPELVEQNISRIVDSSTLRSDILFAISSKIEILDYKEIDGIEIPVKAKKYIYSTINPPTESDAAQLIDYLENSKMSEAAQLADKYTSSDNRQLVASQYIELIPEKTNINKPLRTDDIKISFPDGTMVLHRSLNTSFTIGNSLEGLTESAIGKIDSDVIRSLNDTHTNIRVINKKSTVNNESEIESDTTDSSIYIYFLVFIIIATFMYFSFRWWNWKKLKK